MTRGFRGVLGVFLGGFFVPVVDGNVLCRLQSRPLFHCPLLDHSLMAFDIKSIIDYTHTHTYTQKTAGRAPYTKAAPFLRPC